jgi:hypothetical protein
VRPVEAEMIGAKARGVSPSRSLLQIAGKALTGRPSRS